jgi:4-aminobutyrate aminotransferase/(S)-3-amino-2-methylpropionate transaminase
MYQFKLTPQKAEKKKTKHVNICTDIPAPSTIEIINDTLKNEPSSMNNQLPIVWDKAIDYQVFDNSGNCWIDFTSTIFVANVGHSNPEVCKAIKETVDKQLLNAYYYPTEIKRDFVSKLLQLGPKNLNKVLLLSTGSEANEAAIKMAVKHTTKINPNKRIVVSFINSFHGKTMGSQMLGGKKHEKSWIKHQSPELINVKFPYPWETFSFSETLKELKDLGVDLNNVAAFATESYQGWCACFLPVEYVQQMRQWCTKNSSLLIFDEVQSGFGRTGKFFAFEHYGVEADIICCGKGISSSLPLSAVISKEEIIEPEQSFNSTHGGNPVACAASLASINYIEKYDLVEASRQKGILLENLLLQWMKEKSNLIKKVFCKGLLASVFIECENNTEFVDKLIEIAMRKGLVSVRTASGTLKIGPPLTIPEDAIIEGVQILKDSLIECESV